MAAVVLITALGLAQSGPPNPPIEITDEPHHTLLLKNAQLRAFRLKLQPNEVTAPHSHKSFYVYLSLRPATIGNEVRGRQPVVTHLEPGELHTSKGGFNVAERNDSGEPAEVLVIEALKPNPGEFASPMGGFRYHDSAFGAIFEAPAVRGYAMTIASGGGTEQHPENYDRLVIAVSELQLRDSVAGQPPSELRMKAGDILWVPRSAPHALSNTGTAPATFVTLEFQ